MALLAEIKEQLRIASATTTFDTEIGTLIKVCKEDMISAGITMPEDIEDAADDIKYAVMVYAKANFGWDNPEADRLQAIYESMKCKFALSVTKAYFKVTFTCTEQMEVTFDGNKKESNDSGVVIFYSKAKNHVPYIINGVTDYIDITEDTTISG